MVEEKADNIPSDTSVFSEDPELWADFDAVCQISDYIQKPQSASFTVTMDDGTQNVTSRYGQWKMPTASTAEIRARSRLERKKSLSLKKQTDNRLKSTLKESSSDNQGSEPTSLQSSSLDTSCIPSPNLTSLTKSDPTNEKTPTFNAKTLRELYSDLDIPVNTDRIQRLSQRHLPSKEDAAKLEKHKEHMRRLDEQWPTTLRKVSDTAVEKENGTIATQAENDDVDVESPRDEIPTMKNTEKLPNDPQPPKRDKVAISKTPAKLIVVRPAAGAIDDSDESSGTDSGEENESIAPENDGNKRRNRSTKGRKFKKSFRKFFRRLSDCLTVCCRPCNH